jgi:hypothetical protein
VTVVFLGLPKKWKVIFREKLFVTLTVFFLGLPKKRGHLILFRFILTVVFLGLPKKWTVIFQKNLFFYFLLVLKKLIPFHFDRRFFGASQKMDGHSSRKLGKPYFVLILTVFFWAIFFKKKLIFRTKN